MNPCSYLFRKMKVFTKNNHINVLTHKSRTTGPNWSSGCDRFTPHHHHPNDLVAAAWETHRSVVLQILCVVGKVRQFCPDFSRGPSVWAWYENRWRGWPHFVCEMLINALRHFKAKQTSVTPAKLPPPSPTRSPSLYSPLGHLMIAWQLKASAAPGDKLHQLAINVATARCQVTSLCFHLLPCLHSLGFFCVDIRQLAAIMGQEMIGASPLTLV